MFRHLAANLRHRRRAADLTQQQLADSAGFNRAYISNLERGLCPVEEEHVSRLAAAIGVSSRTLLRPAQARRATATTEPTAVRT